MSLFQGINVVSIEVPDLEAGRAFYRDVLELGEPLYDLPEAGWIEFGAGAPGGHVSLAAAPEGWTPATSTSLVLNVEDCFAARDVLAARGVRCDEPQVFDGFVTWCSFYDPFGNRLQMCSPA